ncbi:MAG: HAD family hydrolase [Lachnospiraceae bacterium]
MQNKDYKKEFEAVIFDMDGVIFDSEKMVIICWQEVAEKYHIEKIEYACRQCLGSNKEAAKAKFLEIYGKDFPYDEYKAEMSTLFHEKCSGGNLALKPGVIELLTYLKEKGKIIALASSTREAVVRQELMDAGILHYFRELVCGDMVSRSKPYPDIYLKACECIGVEPKNAFAIEDSYNGIRSASAGGLRPIMVPDLAKPTKEMEELSEVILPSLLDVKAYCSQFISK